MKLSREAIKGDLRAKVMELAARSGIDARDMTDDEIIPATGLLDSAAILELIVWYEREYGLVLKNEDINIDNLGSVNAMADFLVAQKSI